MAKVVVFDTETTGLIKNVLIPLDRQPKVIEFYGELIDDQTGEVLEEVEFKCNPQLRLEPIITKITGLTNADVDNEPLFRENAHKVVKLFEQADQAVAHNIAYDRNMLAFEFRRMEATLRWPNVLICTVAATEFMKGHRLNLASLHQELFGEAFEGAHRAREDVKALTKCFLELRRRGIV